MLRSQHIAPALRRNIFSPMIAIGILHRDDSSPETIMFDPDETLAALGAPHKARLIELLKSGNSLPWTQIDDELRALRLVQRGHRRTENATLNNWGWAVAMKAAPPETH